MNDALRHYGIRGMRWGIRRTPAQLGRARGEIKAEKIAEQKRTEREKRAAVKSRGTLSNEELQERIRRLQLEKQLRELTDAEISPGRKFVKDVMYDSGKQAATQVSKNAMMFAGKQLVGGKFGQKELADALFNVKESKKDKDNDSDNSSESGKKDKKKNKKNNQNNDDARWEEDAERRWQEAERRARDEEEFRRRYGLR